MNKTVRDMIAGSTPVFAAAGASVRETAQIMLDKGVGAAVIVESGRLMGVFTERDALRFFVATRRNADTTNVGAVMTKDPVTISPETPIEEARQLMLKKGFRHLPVVAGSEILGVVSLRGLAREQHGSDLV